MFNGKANIMTLITQTLQDKVPTFNGNLLKYNEFKRGLHRSIGIIEASNYIDPIKVEEHGVNKAVLVFSMKDLHLLIQ